MENSIFWPHSACHWNCNTVTPPSGCVTNVFQMFSFFHALCGETTPVSLSFSLLPCIILWLTLRRSISVTSNLHLCMREHKNLNLSFVMWDFTFEWPFWRASTYNYVVIHGNEITWSRAYANQLCHLYRLLIAPQLNPQFNFLIWITASLQAGEKSSITD
jgi:hypothetical protein